jgi:tetratricopeptide (TPR) repeat protein
VALNRNKEALECYLKAANTEPTDPVAWANIGYEYYKIKDYVFLCFIFSNK